MKIKTVSTGGLLNNYLKMAWRSTIKNSFTSMVSITGLVIGLTGSFFIGLYILDELAYDKHFRNGHLVYRVTSTYHQDGHVYRSAQSRGDIAGLLINEIPEIHAATRLLPSDEAFIFTDSGAFKERIIYTDSSFLTVFGLDLILGNRANCLSDPSSLIISEQTAMKLFGPHWRQKEVLSTRISIDGRIPLFITGVFKDFPRHSHFSSNLFASIPSGFESWMSNDSELYTYVSLHEQSNPKSLHEKLTSLSAKHLTTTKNAASQINLQPLADIYFSSSLENENASQGNIKNIYALLLISVFLIVITVVNFANLYTAGCFNRLKEVGVRKTIGALHGQLSIQFLSETALITIVALAIAFTLTALFLPTFNSLTGKYLPASSLFSIKTLALIGVLTAVIAVLAGSYPALFLSGRKTIDALKGLKNKSMGTMELRKGLIVLQFFLSSIMITLSIVAFRQVDLITTRDPGFDKENTIVIGNPYMLGSTQNVLAFRNELRNARGVEEISVTGYTPSQERWKRERITFPDRNELSPYRRHANWITVDENFLSTMGIELLAGRNFSENHDHDRDAVIINQTAATQFKLDINGKSAVGAELSCFENENENPGHFKVVGVVADFNFGSLHETVKPIIMKLDYHRFELAIRLSPQYAADETIARIESVWKKSLPLIPFEYSFILNRYNDLHRSDITASRLFSIFCVLTIFVSAMGLFSMVAYSVVNRTKEFGIRKLLGASALNISVLVMGDFLKLILLSYILALPFAWLAAYRWVDNFAYKTEISWWIFATTGSIMLLVCILTLGYQSLKASHANPAENLKHE